MPGTTSVDVNTVRPVTWPIPSLRSTDWPTTLSGCVHRVSAPARCAPMASAAAPIASMIGP